MSFWYKFDKINNCKECGGTGKKQWFDLDGGAIYHWMKPKVKQCPVCKGMKMSVPKFSVGEVVILQSKSRPELNGEDVVKQLVLPGDKFLCRLSNEKVRYKGYTLGYILESTILEGKNTTGEFVVEIVWSESALRKKHQPGEMSFNELMNSLKYPVKVE